MTYSIEKHFLAFMIFLPIILLEYQTTLQKFGKIKHTNYMVYRQQAYSPRGAVEEGKCLVFGQRVHACLKINSRLREHPLESRQRKSPLCSKV